jgi:hypothetical protein
MKRIFYFLLTTIILVSLSIPLAVPASATPANLVVNGGFEYPPTWLGWYPTGTPGFGWDVDKVSGGPSVGLEIQGGYFGPVVEGNQYAELNGAEVDTIYQTLPTVSNSWYIIRFAFSPRPGTADYQNQMSVEWGGSLAGIIGPTAGGSYNNLWMYYSYLVKASSDSTELRFRDLDPDLADTVGTLIDDVSVIQAEPHTTLQTIAVDQDTLPAGGGTVTVVVVDKNDGNVVLTDVSVVLTGYPPFKGSPFNMSAISSSDGDMVTMNPEAVWTFTASIPLVTGTSLTAVGHGLCGDVDVAGPSEIGNIVVKGPPVPASSNPGLMFLALVFAAAITFFVWLRIKRSGNLPG